MNFDHITPGTPFAPSASDWNAMVDAAKEYTQNQLDKPIPAGEYNPFVCEGATTVWVKNERSDGYPCGLGCVLVLDGLAGGTSDVFARPTFKGVLPNQMGTDNQTDQFISGFGRYAICAEAIQHGAVGRAIISGIAVTPIKVQKEWHYRCDLDLGNRWWLKSYPGGSSQILWKEPGTSGSADLEDKWAIVLMGCNPWVHYFGKMVTELTPAGTGTFEIWEYDVRQEGSGSLNEWYATGRTETVHSSLLHQDDGVFPGRWIQAVWNPYCCYLEVEGRECGLEPMV